MSAVTLTPDQQLALAEILSACKVGRHGGRHLLTGHAGSGKTTLMQDVVREFRRLRLDVAVTAPTHKAAAVLRRKLAQAGLADVACITLHSLLSLQPAPDGIKTKLRRRNGAKAVMADAVIVDECSMLDTELMRHIGNLLSHCFVLFVGDPAQLPPVGEKESVSFATRSRSHLSNIVRQAAGNPVLAAAHIIRESQSRGLDWSWCRSVKLPPFGVYMPANADEWMRRAFMSDAFKADNDEFRYLCWTNARVAEVNDKVRRWLYGDMAEPFAVGERALLRAPVFRNGQQIFSTNEEAPVLAIQADVFKFDVEAKGPHEGWTAQLPSWRVTLEAPGGLAVPVHIAREQVDLDRIEARLVKEAKAWPDRWGDRFAFIQEVGRLQSVYALTCHTSQGSTFGTAFIDVDDIRRRARSNVLEMQQMLYVACTRPSKALVLVGAGAAA